MILRIGHWISISGLIGCICSVIGSITWLLLRSTSSIIIVVRHYRLGKTGRLLLDISLRLLIGVPSNNGRLSTLNHWSLVYIVAVGMVLCGKRAHLRYWQTSLDYQPLLIVGLRE